MSRSIFRLSLLLCLAAAGPAFAAGGTAAYRCTVLGNDKACAKAPGAQPLRGKAAHADILAGPPAAKATPRVASGAGAHARLLNGYA